jgi:hypothetical protein
MYFLPFLFVDRCVRCAWLVLCVLLALPLVGRAQTQPAPAWNMAVPESNSQAAGTSTTTAVATDASGNVFITGNFVGRVAFGSTVLISRGNSDLFVAKWVPASSSWAWAQSGGGTDYDGGYGVAVSGSNVFVTGSIINNTANAKAVVFGGGGTTAGTVQVNGASATASEDLVLAKYVDNGTTAALAWTQVGGGTNTDNGQDVAVSGSSVYVTGKIFNNAANANGVVFGGGGTTAGAAQVNGASATASEDLVLAKYVDNGTTAALAWTQVGGGTNTDNGIGMALSSSNIYVTGRIANDRTNANGVVFGGGGTTAGTVQVKGASDSSQDLVLVKYVDNGTTAALAWTQVGGGTNNDLGTGVAVSGNNVYVTGSLVNNAANSNRVVFGGGGTTAGTVQVNGTGATNSADLLLAKYVDNGTTATLAWTQVGGGTDNDFGYGVAVSGNNVYVTGRIINNAANAKAVVFGGGGTTAGTVQVNGASATASEDLVLAKYVDNGTTAALAWTQVGGGTGYDEGTSVAVSGNQVYTVGHVSSAATFGSYIINNGAYVTSVLAGLLDTSAPLATAGKALAKDWRSYPNPTGHAGLTVQMPAVRGAAVVQAELLNALGQVVQRQTAALPATGTSLHLPTAGLATGIYLLHLTAGEDSSTQRIVIE